PVDGEPDVPHYSRARSHHGTREYTEETGARAATACPDQLRRRDGWRDRDERVAVRDGHSRRLHRAADRAAGEAQGPAVRRGDARQLRRRTREYEATPHVLGREQA